MPVFNLNPVHSQHTVDNRVREIAHRQDRVERLQERYASQVDRQRAGDFRGHYQVQAMRLCQSRKREPQVGVAKQNIERLASQLHLLILFQLSCWKLLRSIGDHGVLPARNEDSRVAHARIFNLCNLQFAWHPLLCDEEQHDRCGQDLHGCLVSFFLTVSSNLFKGNSRVRPPDSSTTPRAVMAFTVSEPTLSPG